MKRSHCAYVGRLDEDRKSVFGQIVEEFIEKTVVRINGDKNEDLISLGS